MAMTRGSKVVSESTPVPKVKRWSRPTLTWLGLGLGLGLG